MSPNDDLELEISGRESDGRCGEGELTPEWRELIAAARAARKRAYSPYSHFAVGAAVRTVDGAIHTGCNIESASSGLTVCAERVAVWSAVASGKRQFAALAVVTEGGVMPCGACRQVLVEFASDLPVAAVDLKGRVLLTTLRELLPWPFRSEDLPAG